MIWGGEQENTYSPGGGSRRSIYHPQGPEEGNEPAIISAAHFSPTKRDEPRSTPAPASPSPDLAQPTRHAPRGGLRTRATSFLRERAIFFFLSYELLGRTEGPGPFQLSKERVGRTLNSGTQIRKYPRYLGETSSGERVTRRGFGSGAVWLVVIPEGQARGERPWK